MLVLRFIKKAFFIISFTFVSDSFANISFILYSSFVSFIFSCLPLFNMHHHSYYSTRKLNIYIYWKTLSINKSLKWFSNVAFLKKEYDIFIIFFFNLYILHNIVNSKYFYILNFIYYIKSNIYYYYISHFIGITIFLVATFINFTILFLFNLFVAQFVRIV